MAKLSGVRKTIFAGVLSAALVGGAATPVKAQGLLDIFGGNFLAGYFAVIYTYQSFLNPEFVVNQLSYLTRVLPGFSEDVVSRMYGFAPNQTNDLLGDMLQKYPNLTQDLIDALWAGNVDVSPT